MGSTGESFASDDVPSTRSTPDKPSSEPDELRRRLRELKRRNRELKRENRRLRTSRSTHSENGTNSSEAARTLFDRVFASLDYPAFLVDVKRNGDGPSFEYRDVNPAFEDAAGMDSDDLLGAGPKQRFSQQTKSFVRTQYCRCLSQKRSMVYRMEIDFEEQQGVFRTRLLPYFEDGRVEAIFEVMEPLSTVPERERNHREFMRAVESSGHGVMMTDSDGIITYVNRTFERMMGYTRDEVIGETPEILSSGKHDDAFYEDLWETISGGEVWKGETIDRKKNGELIYVNQTIAPVYDEGGALRSYVSIQEDITEQKEREQELLEKNRAIENSPIGIILTDATEEDNPIIYCNDGFERLTGYSQEEVIGTNCRFLQGEETDPETVDRIRNAIENEEPVKEEIRNYRSNGEMFWNELIITPIRNEEGEVTRFVGYQQDITRRKESERELRLFRETIQRSPDSIFIVDPDTAEFIDVNKTAEEVLDYSRRELLGMRVQDVNPRMEEEIGWEEYLRRMKEDGPLTIETVHRSRDGTEFPVEVHGDFIEFGNQSRIIATSRDISERREAREKLKKKERRFRTLFEEAPIGLWEEDWSGAKRKIEEVVPEGTDDLGVYFDDHPDELEAMTEGIDVVLPNKTVLDMTGATDKQQLLDNFRQIVTGDTLEAVRDELVGLWNGETSVSSKTRIKRFDGEERVILRDLQLVPGHEDDWSRVFVSYRDVTEEERRKTELEEVRHRERRFRQLAENVGGVFWQFDPERSEYLYLSSHCERVFGLTKEQLYDSPEVYLENVHPEDRDLVRELQENRSEGYNETYRMKVNGEWKWIRDRAYPVEEDGTVTMVAGLAEDINEQVERQQELQEQIEETERVSQLKSDYVARTSHDLRTPLNSILGMVDFLESTDLTRNQQEYLRTIRSTGKTMLHITNDILDLDRVESGELELMENPFSVRSLVGEMTNLFVPWIQDEDLTLTMDVQDEVPDRVIGDPNRLKQILVNLIGNAVKFTEEGLIRVSVSNELEAHGSVLLRFNVEDTGPGIPEDQQSQIFEERTSNRSSENVVQPGAGLGLSVCQSLVERMGGEMSVRSEVGDGSTFSFTVRLDVDDREFRERSVDRFELDESRVLVVDDNNLIRRALEAQLTREGVTVDDTGDPCEAQRLLSDPERYRDFDVVFLDRRMDELSGTELLEKLANTPDAIDPRRVYILTGDSEGVVRDDLPDISCAGVLQKPISGEELIDAIRSVLVEHGPNRRPT